MAKGKKKADQTLTQVMAKLLEKELVPDLKARAKMPGVEPVLRQRWEKERAARRTADPYEIWVAHTAEQVGAAWVLSIAFIRTLEDRGLLDRRRLTGNEGYDSEHGFFKLYPALGPRDYLLTVLKELARLPGAEDLLGPKHNPAWRLAPSNAAAQKLLEAWRQDDETRTPLWTFEGTDTRFLGDLYQDLSADVRERYALLQTPDFVERFILKLTLDPAVEEFGLDEVRLIDPTCGSGHFLLGAYDRLFDLRQAREPGVDRRAHALAALAQVHGVDLNPYAVAIARFRLTLAFLEKAGIGKLKDSPKLPLNLAVADSLLVAAKGAALHLARGAESKEGWGYDLFDFEDGEEAERILGKGFHAVVGNPPYITCKDAALRTLYRTLYPQSAVGKYALAAPFTERFLQLGSPGAFVGLINANSFTKREFGKSLIESVLARIDLSFVLDTSGAFIPGHGTPTIILMARAREPLSGAVRLALGRRGEPTTPLVAEQGKVWTSISERFGQPGYEDEYVSIVDVPRSILAKHPWSLSGGGAPDLKSALEGASQALGGQVSDMGFASFTGLDEVFIRDPQAMEVIGVEPELIRPIVMGESIRDWSVEITQVAIVPYDHSDQSPLPFDPSSKWGRALWPYRCIAEAVSSFGGNSRKEEGQRWWEWYRWIPKRYLAPLRIAFAEISTHNHFFLDSGGYVFSRTAPVMLPTVDEAGAKALTVYLNSAVACFWMKQVCYAKTNHTEERPETFEPGTRNFAFNSGALKPMPLPPRSSWPVLAEIYGAVERLDREEAAILPEKVVAAVLAATGPVIEAVQAAAEASARIRGRRIALQEDADWAVYGAFGLCGADDAVPAYLKDGQLESDGRSYCDAPRGQLTLEQESAWRARHDAIAASDRLQLLETQEMKRRWIGGSRGSFATRARTFTERIREAMEFALVRECGKVLLSAGTPLSVRSLLLHLQSTDSCRRALDYLCAGTEFEAWMEDLVGARAVPYLSAWRYTESGLEKRGMWERAWDAQFREDMGEKLVVPLPPRYEQRDFMEPAIWRLRGRLDVPSEALISYPGAERDDDRSPVVGWAGWDHLNRAQALAALYQERKEEAWTKERLEPLLAGLLELVPWLKQWHNEPNAAFGGQRLGDYFEQHVESESREQGLTLDDLRTWRPSTKGKGRKKQ